MIRLPLLLVSALLTSPSHSASQLDQIKANAKFVAERFGPQSEVSSFGCNTESVAYLDKFISRQIRTVRKDQQSQERFTGLFGSFLGECVVALYGGTWVESKDGIHIEVPGNGLVHFVQPFQKVSRRIQIGESESLENYFGNLLPAALGPPVPPRVLRK